MEDNDSIAPQLTLKRIRIEIGLANLPVYPSILYDIYNCRYIELFIYIVSYIFNFLIIIIFYLPPQFQTWPFHCAYAYMLQSIKHIQNNHQSKSNCSP